MTKKYRVKRSATNQTHATKRVLETVVFGRSNGHVFMFEDFDQMTKDRQLMHIQTAGTLLHEAIAKNDLARFQSYYVFMRDQLHVDIEQYTRPIPNPGDEPGHYLATICTAALYYRSEAIVEQNFRFSVYNEGSIFRNTSSSPFSLLNAMSYLVSVQTDCNGRATYEKYAKAFLDFLYETIFNQLPMYLDPQSGLMGVMKKFKHYEAIRPMVESCQNFYYPKFQAGLAPNPPVLGDPLMSIAHGDDSCASVPTDATDLS